MRVHRLTAPPSDDVPVEEKRHWKNLLHAHREHLGFEKTKRRDSMVLPTSRNLLGEVGVGILRRHLAQVLDDRRTTDPATIAATAALSATMSTGRPISTAADFQITTLGRPQELKTAPSGMVICSRIWGWWLPTAAPVAEQRLKDRQVASHMRTSDHVWLPCGRNAKSIIGRLMAVENVPFYENGSRPLFPLPRDDLDRHARAVLANLRRETRVAITPRRIENWLYRQIALDTGGDHSLASLITGHSSDFDRAGRSYLGADPEKMSETYVSAVSAFDSFPTSITPPEISNLVTGSRYVPERSFLQRLAAKHREIISEDRRRKGFDLLRLHDSMATYTLVMIALASGLRRLTAALPPTLQIDPCTGFCVIHDKRENREGLPPGYRSRLVWLCPEARQQIKFYEVHLEGLERRLEGDLKIAVRDLRHSSRSLPFFRFEEGKRENEEVERKREPLQPIDSAGALADLDHQLDKVRPNVWRHFVRSELAGRCPGDILRAFMGHWEQGSEPWCLDSTLDPLRFRQTLSETVPPLLRSLGFEPVAGLQ